ncbi:MAG TPA: potassium channel family protein [Bacillales bacterium]|nr:potassium channel family protein [Bacillales bacterium]
MKRQDPHILSNVFGLLLLYFNVIITFAAIYMLLDHTGAGPVIDHYERYEITEGWSHMIMKPLYFSAITLLSVGYGDITPFGWSRAVSVIEALVGYLLPATVMVQVVRLFPNQFKR